MHSARAKLRESRIRREAVRAAARSKGTYLRDKFHRLKAGCGYKRAAVAIAHKILGCIYHMLSQNVSYTTWEISIWTISTSIT